MFNAVQEKSGDQSGFDKNKWYSIGFGVLVITVVTLIAYSSVFSAGFNWDDDDHVIRIMDLGTLEGLYTIWFKPGTTIQFYPLVFSAYWMQIKLWGLNPFGFHLVNIVFHTGNALLLWLCLKRLQIPGAFWAGCLFAIHPLHVESVAWVTELKNILSAFFYLLAFYSYWNFSNAAEAMAGHGRKNGKLYVMSLVLFGFAMLCKSVTCTLPAVILLLFWWKRGRIGMREVVPLLPFFIVAVILGMLTLRVEADHVLAKGPEWDFSFVERLLIAGRVTWFHAGKMIWPKPLMFNYPRWHLDAGEWWQYLFPFTAIGMLILLWHYRERTGRGPLTACLFIMGTNFPVLGFLNVYSMRFSFVADHYYYISNFGFVALFSAALSLLQDRLSVAFKYSGTVFLGALVLTLSFLTWQQGKIYQSKLTLFNDTLNKNPASWLSYGVRALYYANEGKYDLAMADLDKTLKLKPDESDALLNRGRLYGEKGDYSKAFADFDRAIAIRPWRLDYYIARSVAYRSAGRLGEALIDADMIIAVKPGAAEHYLFRASIYLLQDGYEKALVDLNHAAKLEPDNFQVYANRGLVYYRKGLLSQAINDFDKALDLNPASAETCFNRGLARAAAGLGVLARFDLNKAREFGYPLDEEEIRLILSQKK